MRACNRCGLPIRLEHRNGGPWIALNPDGSVHWDACKAARAKRGPAIIVGKTIVGEHYRELSCSCSVPPWEECPNCEHWQAWNEEQINSALTEILGERR